MTIDYEAVLSAFARKLSCIMATLVLDRYSNSFWLSNTICHSQCSDICTVHGTETDVPHLQITQIHMYIRKRHRIVHLLGRVVLVYRLLVHCTMHWLCRWTPALLYVLLYMLCSIENSSSGGQLLIPASKHFLTTVQENLPLHQLGGNWAGLIAPLSVPRPP